MSAQWAPRGLALYWGAPCSYEIEGQEALNGTIPFLTEGHIANKYYKSHCLHLRPIEAMTEAERVEYKETFYSDYVGDIFDDFDEKYCSVYHLDIGKEGAQAWHMRQGFNMGGWIHRGHGEEWATPAELVALGLVKYMGEEATP